MDAGGGVDGELPAGSVSGDLCGDQGVRPVLCAGRGGGGGAVRSEGDGVCPGSTESEFFEIAHAQKFKINVQATDAVARQAIDALARGQRTILPSWNGRATALLSRLLPVVDYLRCGAGGKATCGGAAAAYAAVSLRGGPAVGRMAPAWQ